MLKSVSRDFGPAMRTGQDDPNDTHNLLCARWKFMFASMWIRRNQDKLIGDAHLEIIHIKLWGYP